MSESNPVERPLGVYLASFYFVLAGFLESIQRYRESDAAFSLNPLAEQSIWHLVTNIAIYLVVGYLIWNYTRIGRLAGLVYGYLTLATYFGAFLLYAKGTPMNPTPLFLTLAVFHVVALIPLVAYLQPARRKKLFQVSLLEILLPRD